MHEALGIFTIMVAWFALVEVLLFLWSALSRASARKNGAYAPPVPPLGCKGQGAMRSAPYDPLRPLSKSYQVSFDRRIVVRRARPGLKHGH